MRFIMFITLKGFFRDRLVHGLLIALVFFAAIPSLSNLSMRQVTELSITLSLSMISVLQLVLAVFLGGTSLWKDIERRYAFSLLALPFSRGRYLLGKFFAVALFTLGVAVVLGSVTCAVVTIAAASYPPDRPIVWWNLLLAIGFDACKYILLSSFAFLFATVSSSFFLPVLGTLAVFLIGSSSQGALDYLGSSEAAKMAPLFKQTVSYLYYLVPNFSAFDLKVNAIYGISVSGRGAAMTLLYFAAYLGSVISLAMLCFSRKEMK